jgi:predicted lipoprotein
MVTARFAWRRGAAVLLLASCAAACRERQSEPEAEAPVPARRALLEAAATCIPGLIGEATTRAEQLAAACRDWADSRAAADRDATRAAWTETMAIWQQLEVLQVGPAGQKGVAVGGQDLRDAVYSWPLVSRCRVDQQIVAEGWLDPGLGGAPLNVRGLDALEYLLFHEGSDNGCAGTNLINTDGSWAALDADELERRRSGYAAAAADDVLGNLGLLREAWAAGGGDFAGQLVRAGQGGELFEREADAVNALSDALFYLDSETKDRKLAQPLGLLECTTPTCPEALESRFAHRSKHHVRDNLDGFERIFHGCGPDGAGAGMDDLLVALEFDDLAERMTEAHAGALASVDAIEEEDLEQALNDDPASVKALHTALKQLTDLLKTELVTALNLELPPLVQGDND